MTQGDDNSLAGIALLQDLEPNELATLEQQCRWKWFDTHEQIIDRQSEGSEVCFVVKGSVRVVIYSLSGREITLDDLTEGGHFGELAAIDQLPRSASVMALTKSLIAFLPPEHFIAALKNHPDMGIRVMRNLAQVIRASTDRIMDLSTLGANNRVHAELLRQARSTLNFDNAAEIRPIPVHSDIASRVSTTRETVARVMNDLARKGVVERTKDALIIHDIEKLQDMVDEVRGD